MRKTLFLTIATQIKEHVPGIAHIDLWNEHLTNIQAETAWPVPSVFIEFGQYNVKQLANHVYTADIPVHLHIITRAKPARRGIDDEQRFTEMLSYFDLIDRIHQVMVTIHSDTISTPMLTTSVTNHNHGELIESIESYTIASRDLTAYRFTQNKRLDDINYIISRV